MFSMTQAPLSKCSPPTPSADDIERFLRVLLHDGRLNFADIEILKAHAGLDHRTGQNWQIAEAAAEGVRRQVYEQLTPSMRREVPQWDHAPSWHVVDCLQRWLGYALANEFAFYRSQVAQRDDQTQRWWMALAETGCDADGKCIEATLRKEIAAALERCTPSHE